MFIYHKSWTRKYNFLLLLMMLLFQLKSIKRKEATTKKQFLINCLSCWIGKSLLIKATTTQNWEQRRRANVAACVVKLFHFHIFIFSLSVSTYDFSIQSYTIKIIIKHISSFLFCYFLLLPTSWCFYAFNLPFNDGWCLWQIHKNT